MGGPPADEAERGRGREPRPAPRGAAIRLGAALAAALLVAACGASNPPAVLLDQSGTGNASASFVASSTHGWDLDWSYDCSRNGGTGIFVVDVYGADRTPDFKHPGVSEQGDKDSGVYHVPEKGRFYLDITTTCKWTVKVMEEA